MRAGFPHSEIHGSKLVRSSPWLIAAYHVLHRLSTPRHPPNALKALDHSHYRCPPKCHRNEERPAFHCLPDEDLRFLGFSRPTLACIRANLFFTMSMNTRYRSITNLCFRTLLPPRDRGGARRDRTDDLLLAKQALSQLSYGPDKTAALRRRKWWAWVDSNYRPHPYQGCALTD